MTRRQIRENIFRILFSLEFNNANEMEEQIALQLESAKLFADEEELSDYSGGGANLEMSLATAETSPEEGTAADVAFVKAKLLAIVAKKEEIDKTIEGISEGWKINRIGKAELAILRLAIYEMKFDDDIPEGVAINEAVELAKSYCDPDAKKFINALLAKLTK